MKKNYVKAISKFSLVNIFIVLVVLNFIRIDNTSHSVSDTLRPFLLQTIILVLIFFIIWHLISTGAKKSN
jgi:hypothetical protein